MKKIVLMGQRANRTPFSYPPYKALFQRKFKYVQSPADADVLVYSCLMDIHDSADEIARILTQGPDRQLVVLSEEPLWDTLWGGDFLAKQSIIRLAGRDYSFFYLNHFTTRIYDFDKIPYFLTTSDEYFARYSFLFARNRTVKDTELKSLWANASIRAAFYAEYRDDAQYDACYRADDIRGLSRYRTLVANEMTGAGIVRVGRGWRSTAIRQTLPDWHLDKLAALDRSAFLLSAIENTHQWNYISEKIFDAFAVLAVPLYFSGWMHSLRRIVPDGSYLNLHGLNVAQAVAKVGAFSPHRAFRDRYREAQSGLADLFSQPLALIAERGRVVSEVIAEFEMF